MLAPSAGPHWTCKCDPCCPLPTPLQSLVVVGIDTRIRGDQREITIASCPELPAGTSNHAAPAGTLSTRSSCCTDTPVAPLLQNHPSLVRHTSAAHTPHHTLPCLHIRLGTHLVPSCASRIDLHQYSPRTLSAVASVFG
jgi:hypothetical protein